MDCDLKKAMQELDAKLRAKESSFRRAMDAGDHEYADMLAVEIMDLEKELDELHRRKYGS